MTNGDKSWHENGPSHDKGVIQRQIDKLVYRLYDLTEDEIAIVEEGVG